MRKLIGINIVFLAIFTLSALNSQIYAQEVKKQSDIEDDYKEYKLSIPLKKMAEHIHVDGQGRPLNGKYKNKVGRQKSPVFCNYENGKREGPCYVFNNSGSTLSMVQHKKNNKMHGLRIHYYENGEPEREVNYVDGIQHGKNTYYDENGIINKVTYWQHGEWTKAEFYDEHGNKLNGTRESLSQYGDKIVICAKNGILHGEKLRYYKTGQLYVKSIYDNGTLMEKWKYDEKGDLYEHEKNGEILLQWRFDENDKLYHYKKK